MCACAVSDTFDWEAASSHVQGGAAFVVMACLAGFMTTVLNLLANTRQFSGILGLASIGANTVCGVYGSLSVAVHHRTAAALLRCCCCVVAVLLLRRRCCAVR